MIQKDKAVDVYLEELAPDRKIPLEKLRELTLAAVPGVKETFQQVLPYY